MVHLRHKDELDNLHVHRLSAMSALALGGLLGQGICALAASFGSEARSAERMKLLALLVVLESQGLELAPTSAGNGFALARPFDSL